MVRWLLRLVLAGWVVGSLLAGWRDVAATNDHSKRSRCHLTRNCHPGFTPMTARYTPIKEVR